ncbi:50S ribosomal protein L23 [Salinibacter grassmerensis]|uniref:50S ribosomal protein L23 n=1 Tax=Salinibacter grassmerensis TaxID=3040353 RepID=UPI0021E8BF1C|nr:50S ribosomal protein L23 [Salinibacter grassmerensis]
MSKRVLIRPYVTEKTTQQMQEGKYSFMCGLDATKIEIRRAVENRYEGVEVEDVRTQVVPGKRRRQFRDGNMIEGRTSGFKKAIVALDPDGEQIDFFEGI